MPSLSSEKKAQLKKLQSVLKKTVEQYQLAEKNIAKLTAYANELKEDLELPQDSKRNRAKIKTAQKTLPTITERIDGQKEAASNYHEQIIALRSSIEKLQSTSNVPTDIAHGAERDPDQIKRQTRIEAAKGQIARLTPAVKSQTFVLKREQDLLAHYREQIAKNQESLKRYDVDSDEYEFASENIKIAQQAIEGQNQTIVTAENKLTKLQDALAKQQQILKDLGA